jgi:ATP adenylyltransferase
MQHLWTPWRMAYIRGEKTPVDGCIFCTKINGSDDEEQIIARSAFVYVTLNRYPYNNGHLLVVPYEHIDSQEAMTVEGITNLMVTVNRALRRAAPSVPSARIQSRREHRAGRGRRRGRALSFSCRSALDG